jgi:hypothetical protein
MRFTALVVAAAFTLASATAWACPMQTAAKDSQTVASSNGSAPSTPIPPRGKNG